MTQGQTRGLTCRSASVDKVKYDVGKNGGLRLFVHILEHFRPHLQILYWAGLALGNLSCGYGTLDSVNFKIM